MSIGPIRSKVQHPPPSAPEGLAHGANAFCVTADYHVVLISGDGKRWGWPGGRPEGVESWEQTLRREMLEKACAVVVAPRLFGFCRGTCLTGPERGRVLVRSLWLPEVDLLPWEPRFDINHRRVVPAADLLRHLWIEQGYEPIYRRALTEAGCNLPGSLIMALWLDVDRQPAGFLEAFLRVGMTALSAFGLFAVMAMLVCYAFENRSPWFIFGVRG